MLCLFCATWLDHPWVWSSQRWHWHSLCTRLIMHMRCIPWLAIESSQLNQLIAFLRKPKPQYTACTARSKHRIHLHQVLKREQHDNPLRAPRRMSGAGCC